MCAPGHDLTRRRESQKASEGSGTDTLVWGESERVGSHVKDTLSTALTMSTFSGHGGRPARAAEGHACAGPSGSPRPGPRLGFPSRVPRVSTGRT